jgi:hypothetical protein
MVEWANIVVSCFLAKFFVVDLLDIVSMIHIRSFLIQVGHGERMFCNPISRKNSTKVIIVLPLC